MRTLHSQTADDLEILTILRDEQRDLSEEAVRSGKITWRLHWDAPPWELTKSRWIESFPTTFVLDRHGRVAAVNLRGEELEAKIHSLGSAK